MELNVNLGKDSYRILIERGLLKRADVGIFSAGTTCLQQFLHPPLSQEYSSFYIIAANSNWHCEKCRFF